MIFYIKFQVVSSSYMHISFIQSKCNIWLISPSQYVSIISLLHVYNVELVTYKWRWRLGVVVTALDVINEVTLREYVGPR